MYLEIKSVQAYLSSGQSYRRPAYGNLCFCQAVSSLFVHSTSEKKILGYSTNSLYIYIYIYIVKSSIPYNHIIVNIIFFIIIIIIIIIIFYYHKGSPDQRQQVPTHRQQNEQTVEVEHGGRSSGPGQGRLKREQHEPCVV